MVVLTVPIGGSVSPFWLIFVEGTKCVVEGYPIDRLSNYLFIGSSEMWPDIGLGQSLRNVVTKHLGEAHGALLALPDSATSTQDANWTTPLSGLPQRLSGLTVDEQAATRLLAAQRLRDVRELAAHLHDVDPDNAHLSAPLARACRYVSDECLYNIDGEPVLVYWGHGTETGEDLLQIQAEPPMLPPLLPDAVVTSENVPWYRRVPMWLWWVLGAVGLLLFLALLWVLFWPESNVTAKTPVVPPMTQNTPKTPASPTPAPQIPAQPIPAQPTPTQSDSVAPVAVQPVTVPVTPTVVAPMDARLQLRAAQTREEYLRRQIVGLENQLANTLKACSLPQTPVTKALPLDTPPLRPTPEVLPKAQPNPEPTPMPEPSPQAQVKPQSTPPLEPCPVAREPWEAPEVVMVFDISGSMGLPMDMDADLAKQLMARAIAGDVDAMRELSSLSKQSGEKRIDHAKVAVSEVVNSLPGDIDTGLVLVGDCSGAISHKFYAPPARGEMLSLIDSLTPQQGTPLARGVERAGNMISASVSEGVIVLISDGQDSCGGDPCAVALALAQAKPNVKINVVDIGGSGAGQCLADATGGRTMVVNRLEDLQSSIQQATGQDTPAHCR